jgi:hypothetical protein
MTTDTPLTRYRAIKRAPASGSSLPSYTTWWDTTPNRPDIRSTGMPQYDPCVQSFVAINIHKVHQATVVKNILA